MGLDEAGDGDNCSDEDECEEYNKSLSRKRKRGRRDSDADMFDIDYVANEDPREDEDAAERREANRLYKC